MISTITPSMNICLPMTYFLPQNHHHHPPFSILPLLLQLKIPFILAGELQSDPNHHHFETDMQREISDLLSSGILEIIPRSSVPSEN
jgi:hypothetical protein